MVIKKIDDSELKKLIEKTLLEQQDKVILKGLLIAEIKLGLLQEYDIETNSNRIRALLEHMPRMTKTLMLGNKEYPYIYRTKRLHTCNDRSFL